MWRRSSRLMVSAQNGSSGAVSGWSSDEAVDPSKSSSAYVVRVERLTPAQVLAEILELTALIAQKDPRRHGRVDTAAQADDHFPKAALANVVAGSQHQGGIRAGLFSLHLLVDFSRQAVGIERPLSDR